MMSEENITVELTGADEFHCFKLSFNQANVDEHIEIFLHTTQAVDLVHKLSLAICEKHRQDSAQLLKSRYGIEFRLE